MATKLLSWGASPSLSYSKDSTLMRDKGTEVIGAHETVGKEACLRWGGMLQRFSTGCDHREPAGHISQRYSKV